MPNKGIIIITQNKNGRLESTAAGSLLLGLVDYRCGSGPTKEGGEQDAT